MIELLIILLLFFILHVCLWFRNESVRNIRTNILSDIEPGDPKFYDKLKKFKSISYESMLFSFKSIHRLDKEMRKKIFGGRKYYKKELVWNSAWHKFLDKFCLYIVVICALFSVFTLNINFIYLMVSAGILFILNSANSHLEYKKTDMYCIKGKRR